MSHKLVSLFIGEGEYYTRADADKVIAELKQEIERLKKENEMALVGVNLRSPTTDGRLI